MADELHNLRNYGAVQYCEVPHPSGSVRAFPMIHHLCAETGCNLSNFVADPYFTPHERQLINQTNDQTSPILVSKTADGLIFHIQNRFIAGMSGKSFYEPHSTDPVKLFCMADKTHTSSAKPFHVVMANSHCDLHQLSRHAVTDHILNQILAVKSPCCKGTPRVIFDAPNFGTFSSRMLVGPEVHDLKLSFLKLIANMAQQGTGVYNKTIKLKPEFSKLLMLKNAHGHIRCDRCKDGIIGYRVRQHNQKKSFVFVANSNDFHADEPSQAEVSMLQVMKMDYADTSKKGPRIVVRDCQKEETTTEEEEEEGGEETPSEDHSVHPQMTVQEIINVVERAFRARLLEHHGCHLFPLYCELLEQKQQAMGSTHFRGSVLGG